MTLPTWNGNVPDAALPTPEPVVVELLRRMLPGVFDIATPRTEPTRKKTYPFVRVTHTNDREAPTTWERAAIFQLDIWGREEGEAADLAAFLAYAWPMVRDSETDQGYVSGGWVESQPRLVAPVPSEPPRYMMAVGARIHARNPE